MGEPQLKEKTAANCDVRWEKEKTQEDNRKSNLSIYFVDWFY